MQLIEEVDEMVWRWGNGKLHQKQNTELSELKCLAVQENLNLYTFLKYAIMTKKYIELV